MITLKMNAYADNEKRGLCAIMEGGLKNLKDLYCTNDCKNCRVKNVCDDVTSTVDYLQRITRPA